jgi:hypothetical protein
MKMASAAPGGIGMTHIPPFSYLAVQGIEAQRTAAAEKQRQLRKAQAQEKNLAAHEDELEHLVESSEEVQPIHDEAGKQQNRRKRQTPDHKEEEDGKPPHIDLTA